MLKNCWLSCDVRRSDVWRVCSDDDVHLKVEENRSEYVTNEHGIIYKGSVDYITPMKWDYGQVCTDRG